MDSGLNDSAGNGCSKGYWLLVNSRVKDQSGFTNNY